MYYLCRAIKINEDMIQLATIWIISVVAFFVLWALLAKVIRKVSEKKVGSEEVESEEVVSSNQQNIQQ